MEDVSSSGGTSAPPSKSGFLVVGIGGSAGSIPSFREFFRHVPEDSGMAYVVILHLSPDHESRLAEVIQGSSTIPVKQVSQSEKVQPDHVYVIPPNKSLAMSDGMLLVSEISGFEERRAPVDIFFRTLADTHDSRAVCVVMSGTGADGSMGLRRVKEYNGLVLVQDPAEAEFEAMPRNSIATGLADFIVPAAEMPRRIIAYRDRLRTMPLTIESHAAEDERAMTQIFTQLRLRTKQDFTNYKRPTVLRRIERRLAVLEIARLTEYAAFMKDHPEEADALLRELLISVTNFFRDKEIWERLGQTVVRKALSGKTSDDHLRVWAAGCATGEEAYSLAMVFAEATAGLASAPTIQIFASDLDEEAISKARNGYYSTAEVADVSPERLRRFFMKEPEGYRVRRELRELVLFAHHNLIKDPPFSHLDFVSCRNVLIYLNRSAQERAMAVLHFALEPGGYLFLGTAEAPDAAGHLFIPVDKEAHVYQSRAVARMPPPVPMAAPVDARPAPPERRDDRNRPRFAPLDLHQRMFEDYARPSLIVDEQYDIVHLTERAGKYLQFPSGDASLNLLAVLRPELRFDVRSALFQAAQNGAAVTVAGVVVHTPERMETVNITVRPALPPAEQGAGFFLVIFEEETREGGDAAARDAAAGEPALRQMEEELAHLRAQLRRTVERYEVQVEEGRAANEELQAINEELRSTAEELETSREELQSVNEELQTVNQELKTKIDEITHANNDMRNLMSSTEIGTIFVDRALRVKLFTPRARDIFNLIPADVGRPLLDINSKLTMGALTEDLERVLERLQTVEREVITADGRWHLMRLLPYRTSEDRIDGVVITFLDVTQLKVAEEAERRGREELEVRVDERTKELTDATAMLHAIIEASPLAIVAVDGEQIVTTWNASAARMFGVPPDEVCGKRLPDLAAGGLGVYRTLLEVMTEGVGDPGQRPHEAQMQRSDGTALHVTIFPAAVRSPDGGVYAFMGLLQDITDRVRFEQEREMLLRRIVSGQEDDRQRIARELHDELGQHLTALKVGLETLRNTDVERLKAIVNEIDRSVDRLAFELRPPALDDLGLHGAMASLLEQFTVDSGVRADVHTTGSDAERLPPAVETTLYRVLQEALTNVWKHAGAKSVSVILERNPAQVQMIVEDDGSGFSDNDTADDARARFGLVGIRERVALIGGTLNIESAPGSGTTLYVRVPLTRAAASGA